MQNVQLMHDFEIAFSKLFTIFIVLSQIYADKGVNVLGILTCMVTKCPFHNTLTIFKTFSLPLMLWQENVQFSHKS